MKDKYLESIRELRIDCGGCSGLCCIGLCFRKADGFPYDKNAGEPCHYLMTDYKCRIHNDLVDMKLKGCLNYDCLGAGQKVSKKITHEDNWINDPIISNEIYQVFIKVLQLHQIKLYLIQAASISDNKENIELIEKYIMENNEVTSLSYTDILKFDIEEYRTKANKVIKSTFKFDIATKRKDYIGKNFKGQNLNDRDFSMTLLIGADLEGCSLKGTNFLGADLRDVQIGSTDLSNSYFLTQMQINSAKGNKETKLPDYLLKPEYWQN